MDALWFGNLAGAASASIDHAPSPRSTDFATRTRRGNHRRSQTYTADTICRLPPLTRDLRSTIRRSASSRRRRSVFASARRSRSRSEGRRNERKAFYNVFHHVTIASASSPRITAVCGTRPAPFLRFFHRPPYYQTTWFLSLVVAAVVGFPGALYRLRLR